MGVRRGGQLPPPLDFGSRCISGRTFYKQLPAAVTTAASCTQKGLFYRPCRSKFPNFLCACARTVPKSVFVAGAREKWSIFLLFIAFTCTHVCLKLKKKYNVLIYVLKFWCLQWKKPHDRPFYVLSSRKVITYSYKENIFFLDYKNAPI